MWRLKPRSHKIRSTTKIVHSMLNPQRPFERVKAHLSCAGRSQRLPTFQARCLETWSDQSAKRAHPRRCEAAPGWFKGRPRLRDRSLEGCHPPAKTDPRAIKSVVYQRFTYHIRWQVRANYSVQHCSQKQVSGLGSSSLEETDSFPGPET